MERDVVEGDDGAEGVSGISFMGRKSHIKIKRAKLDIYNFSAFV